VLFSLIKDASKSVPAPKYVNFPVAPFKSYISALGIVESDGGNISLGGPTDRIVDQICVHAGEKVKKGQVLVQLQNRDLRAELEIQKVAKENAQLNVEKLQSLPRKEDVALAESAVKSSEIELHAAKGQYEMVEGLQRTKALSLEEINRRYYNLQLAEAKVAQAEAEAEKVKQGTWKPDLEMAQLQVKQAEANIERIRAEIDKTVVRSPIDGSVIEIKTHAGEYPSYPMMIIGDTQELDLKVSINQFDAPYFNKKAKAVAYVQGDPNTQIELEFLRLTPYLTSKQNIANDVKEVVDTKVLQVVYRIKNQNAPLYVGQPMDVYIEAEYKK
jgi:multidrug efflux pump subunit AcrA (membrane-fusion protein)